MDTKHAFSATGPVIADDLLVGDRSTARAFREARLFLRLTRLISSNLELLDLLHQLFDLLAGHRIRNHMTRLKQLIRQSFAQ